MTSFSNQLSKYCLRHWVFYIGNSLDQLGQLEIRLINLARFFTKGLYLKLCLKINLDS